LSKKILQHR